MQIKGEEFLI